MLEAVNNEEKLITMTLSPNRIEEIEDQATRVLYSVFEDAKEIPIPVDLKKILDFYKIQYLEGDFGEPLKEVSGALVVEGDSKTIMIASDEQATRIRFTIAHELGHIILHKKENDTEVFYRKNAIDPSLGFDPAKATNETEANWFAASLLMPRGYVEKYTNIGAPLEDLAEIFSVSRTAMLYRVRSLGILFKLRTA